MVQVFALLSGAAIGFVASRLMRRPAHSASAASVVRNVGGALGARRGLSLPELQRATFSEMMRHVRVGAAGHTVVPVRYLVHLHPSDAAVVEESPRFFTDGLAEALRSATAAHDWTMDGPVSINVEADGSRRPGAPAVLAVPPGRAASTPPTPPPQAPTASVAPTAPDAGRSPAVPGGASRPMALHRPDSGERIALLQDPVTIGRSADRDIVIDDKRVSRHHAVVAPHGLGWIVTDMGSSNGTRLNGSTLEAGQPATLQPGDSIEVGPVKLRFDIDDRGAGGPDATSVGPQPTEATSVLDDDARQRISGEYHWSDDDPRPGSAGGRRT